MGLGRSAFVVVVVVLVLVLEVLAAGAVALRVGVSLGGDLVVVEKWWKMSWRRENHRRLSAVVGSSVVGSLVLEV